MSQTSTAVQPSPAPAADPAPKEPPRSADPVDLLLTLRTMSTGAPDRDGVQDAMAQLYDLFATRVYGMALRIVRDQALAEDITQEVFLNLWQTAAAFDPERGSATNWILCLAHRRAVERVRSAQRSRDRDTTFTARNHTADYDSTQEAALASVEGEALRAALGALTPDHRHVLELAYFEGRTHSEISTILALPLGTAKSRIRAALQCLRGVILSPATGTALTA